MNSQKSYSKYYAFMQPFLDTRNELLIAQAKKEYKAMYKREWRKQFRQTNKEITTGWTAHEYKEIKRYAKEHSMTTAQFIKKATFSYCDKRYLVPNEVDVQKTIQLLAMTYNSIESLLENNTTNDTKVIQELVLQLEKELRETLLSPYTIEQIIERLIQKEPTQRTKLITYIQNLQ